MATVTKYYKPSELLADIDSHGIYNTEMLKQCAFDCESIPCSTLASQHQAIEARGLGGWTKGDQDDWVFTGWQAAEALADEFLPGQNPSGYLQGRGSRFRACKAALEAAGH